jgi:hypothetical protein
MNSPKRDQGLSSPAFRDYRSAPCLIPSLYRAHHCERLCRKWLTEELPDERRSYIVDAVERRVGLKNPLSQFRGARTQILVDILR